MKERDESPIVIIVSRMISPFIMMFGAYVIAHGHYGPGGGFQGGALLAASILLIRLTAGSRISELQFRRIWGTPIGVVGVSIFFGVGVICMLNGGEVLNYAHFIIPGVDGPMLRSLGILVVEVGIGLAVMGILVSIYDDLLEEDEPRELYRREDE
ncbi:MAG: hypothetical protein M0Q23_05760 [Syntrophales bacterium]|nr:hypothetical protein [Syntrophales bacterium]MCK9528140.1 hypothetical protein [Syntrophales bacterium]MDX9921110.1 MnhB domain-containing protein [Syntrophales bacterium]